MNIGTLTVSLAVDSSRLVAAQGAIDNFAKRAETSLNRVAQRFRTFGYLTTAILTYPIIQAGKAILNASKDFEFAMQKIVGLAGVSQKTVDEWSKTILSMAPEVAQTPVKLAEALYFVASSGIKGAQALDVLKISAIAATAGMGETADIAKLLVFSLNAYKNTGLTAVKMADMLTVAIKEGAIEAEGFAGAVQQVIPIASAMGVTMGQVMGTMAAMSLQGANAANSAVYLKGILNSILKIKPNSQAAKALDKLKSSAVDLRNKLGSGPNGLMDVLLQIQEWSKTNPYLLNQVFGNIRAMTGDLSLMGKNLVANQKVITDVVKAEGVLALASAAVADTIKVKLAKAAASVQTSLITLGTTISPALTSLLEWLSKKLQDLTKWWDSLTNAQQRHKLIIVAIIAVLGPLSLMTSALIYTFTALLAVINGVAKAFVFLASRIVVEGQIASISTAIKTLTISMSTALPTIATWGIAIIAIGGAIAIALPFIQKYIDKIKEYKAVQTEMQKALEFTSPSMELDAFIGKRMNVLKKLNQEELIDLKTNISQRIALERKRLLDAEGTGKKEIENEQFIVDEKKKIVEGLDSWELYKINKRIKEYIKNRQNEVAYDKIAAQDTIDFYEKEFKNVDKLILKPIIPIIPPIDPDALDSLEKLRTILDQLADVSDLPFVNMGLYAIKFSKDLDSVNTSLDITKMKFEQMQAMSDAINKSPFLLLGKSTRVSALAPAPTMPPGYLTRDEQEQIDTVNELTNGLLKQYEAVGALRDIFMEFFKGIENGWKNLMNVILNEFERLVSEMLARKLLNFLIKVFAGIGTGGIGTAAIAGLNIGLPGGVFGIPFFAKGGIVPAGYPHDTYPAMLSSGEQIIPARASLSNIESAKHNINITLDGSIYGKDMKLFIRRIYES